MPINECKYQVEVKLSVFKNMRGEGISLFDYETLMTIGQDEQGYLIDMTEEPMVDTKELRIQPLDSLRVSAFVASLMLDTGEYGFDKRFAEEIGKVSAYAMSDLDEVVNRAIEATRAAVYGHMGFADMQRKQLFEELKEDARVVNALGGTVGITGFDSGEGNGVSVRCTVIDGDTGGTVKQTCDIAIASPGMNYATYERI